ncbi:peptidoglycan-associated lipoprotein Pal [Candidatus Latescibacterota bacterium]
MHKCKLAIVLTLGLALSFTFFATGCGKKKTAPASTPTVKAPERKPAPQPRVQQAPRKTDEKLTVPSDLKLSTIYFDYDKSNIRSDQRSSLADNAAILSKYSTVRIRIEGHCDERGSDEYNLALGQRRADSARQYLTEYGISSSRITTLTYGESRPVSLGHNESSWAQNRRCEFIITSR